ncbi:RraA-like protein [Westerdykella ornata]|uniref:RraA-like protein n=1 Tax=Westerdykella ornata TaxID=318751 RepID=A0A6A6JKE0_WESOR|nr:RraA-like protein [Westerdykella ornata]KAF2276724.1 RraA-like protein [Westerdykella ornata]
MPESNLSAEEASTPYADLTRPDTIVLISQPPDQTCAVVGGIMALRMQKLGARGIIVDGRVRDLSALRELGIPVWSRGTSVVGAGAETRFHAKEVAVRIGGVEVRPGDFVVVDEEEGGVVVCPRERVGEVLGLLAGEEGLVGRDGRVVEWVEKGGSVREGFEMFR